MKKVIRPVRVQAQKVPVTARMFTDGRVHDLYHDSSSLPAAGLRCAESLYYEIQLSGKFYLLPSQFECPPPGVVCITIRAIKAKLTDGTDLGDAIVVSAEQPSAKHPGYYKLLLEYMWMAGKDESAAGRTRSFLAELDRVLESK